MKKIKTILLLTIMTLLSNITFGQTYIMTYTVNVGTHTDVFPTELFSITVGSTTGAGTDSIIYEFPGQITNLNFEIKLDYNSVVNDGYFINNTNYGLYNYNHYLNTQFYYNVTNTLATSYTLTFPKDTIYKLRLYYYFNGNADVMSNFTCYVRNYHVVKTLPSTFTALFFTGFVSSLTTYTATSTPTTLSNIPTGWGQTLTTTVSSTTCITSYGITDCASTTVLQIINPDGDLTYTITYNRPAQTPTDPLLSIIGAASEQANLITYPNPFTNFVTIKFNTTINTMPIELYNIKGQLLMQNTEKRKLGINEIQFNTEKLPSGMYFIKYGIQTKKLFKE